MGKLTRKERRSAWKLLWTTNIEGSNRKEKRQNWYKMWKNFK